MSAVRPNCKGFNNFEGNHSKQSTFVSTILNQILSFPFTTNNNTNNNTIISRSGNDLCSNGQLEHLTSLYDICFLSSDTMAGMSMVLNMGILIFWELLFIFFSQKFWWFSLSLCS